MTAMNMGKFNENVSCIYIFKCQNEPCRLEFAVFSWWENWEKTYKPFCPECGQQHSTFYE
jgi:hypothetical protein